MLLLCRNVKCTMADSEPNFGTGISSASLVHSAYVLHLQNLLSQILWMVLVNVIDMHNPVSLRCKETGLWRTMADSNRRHQASEACALSIWANGACLIP